MTIRHPKHQQGRRDTRIKPVLPVPPVPTKYHKQVDKLLTAAERERAEVERKAQVRAEQLEHEQQPHRHKYKKVLRVTEEGNRVVGCNCGDSILVPGVEQAS